MKERATPAKPPCPPTAAQEDGPYARRPAPVAGPRSAGEIALPPQAPRCLTAAELDQPRNGARVTVAGLVILRQRPGTAKGVIFITLEDETGVINVIVWRKLYEAYRRAVIAGRMLRVTGRIQREGAVLHLIAEVVEDISPLLDRLLEPKRQSG